MFARKCVLSLIFLGAARALDLDTSSPDSIKEAAKTIAGEIITQYRATEDFVPGLFSDPYYWWEAGAVFDGLVEYSYLTGDTQYNDLISEALEWQAGKEQMFEPANQTKTLGNDDQAFWALAAMTAADVGFPKPKQGEWWELAANVFDRQVSRWDEAKCGGGLKWQIFSFNNGYNYKNSASNGNFFLLSARLAAFTGNKTYADWADKVFKWTQDIGLMDDDYHVFDGTDDRTNCSEVNQMQWTSNMGIFAEGAALMFNFTGGDEKWKDAVSGLVESSDIFQEDDSSLTEVACESSDTCNIDQRAFKGIASRSLARAGLAAPFVSELVDKVIEASAKGAAKNCDFEGGNGCGLSWNEGPANSTGSEMNLGETFAAMEVVQALLYSDPAAPYNKTGFEQGDGDLNRTSPSSSNGSETSSAGAPESTGAAERIEIAGTLAFAAVLLAVVGL